MGIFGKSQTRSIQRYFLRIFIPIVLLVSTVFSGLLAWNDYRVNKASRLDSQKLTFETFAAVVRQPLIQGSLIEARIRASELAQNSQIYCIEIKSISETIQSCNKQKTSSSGLHRMDTDLYFSEDASNWMGHISITFDNSDLIAGIWKNAGKNAIGFVLLAVILFAGLSIGFSRIRIELNELMKILETKTSDKERTPTFKISEFSSLAKNLSYQFEVTKAAAEAKAALDVARQVAHDIRSPIVSLQVALNAAQVQLDPTVKGVLNHSAQRISDIANDVINQYTASNKNSEYRVPIQKLPMSVDLALNEMVAEKSLMCRQMPQVSVQTKLNAEDTFIEMQVSDFKRIISNLIDNALYAVSDRGSIDVNCTRIVNECCISILDNGSGISESVLKTILEKGGSFGKPNGKGLGLQWAKKTIEKHNGRILILSKEGVGTEVRIFLPMSMNQKVKVQTGAQLSLAAKEA